MTFKIGANESAARTGCCRYNGDASMRQRARNCIAASFAGRSINSCMVNKQMVATDTVRVALQAYRFTVTYDHMRYEITSIYAVTEIAIGKRGCLS